MSGLEQSQKGRRGSLLSIQPFISLFSKNCAVNSCCPDLKSGHMHTHTRTDLTCAQDTPIHTHSQFYVECLFCGTQFGDSSNGLSSQRWKLRLWEAKSPPQSPRDRQMIVHKKRPHWHLDLGRGRRFSKVNSGKSFQSIRRFRKIAPVLGLGAGRGGTGRCRSVTLPKASRPLPHRRDKRQFPQ